MDAITLPTTTQLYVVVGGQPAASHLLDLAARLALRGSLLLLDCGNRANPLPLVRELRRLTNDPVTALHNIQTARAFTCYQVATLLEQTARLPYQQPVLIFDLLATFYDENITYAESRRLLEHSLRCITQIRRSAAVVVSARPPLAAFPERKAFLEMVCGLSDRFWVEETPSADLPQQLSLFQ
jgi:hypothetical protein